MDNNKYVATDLNALILFADNHLLAVNKPAGLLTQDSGTGLRNLEDWAREWVRVEKNKPGSVFLNAVHRIDRAVSGVVLFARTSKALTRLNEDIRKRNCQKIYHAWVEGSPQEEAAELIHGLKHEHQRGQIVRADSPEAQKAILRYRLLGRKDGRALLEVDLETGRYHQIRAQLSAIGCPIAGDDRYGAQTTSPDGSIALHHARLKITHPTTKEPLEILAPYPDGILWWK